MSDQNVQVPGSPTPEQGFQPSQPQPDAQPVGAGGQPRQEPPAEPQFLTKAEAERLKAEAVEEAFRRSQGLYDRGNERIRQRITDLEQTWSAYEQSGGQPLTEAQKNQMRLAAADQIRAEELAAPVETQAAQQRPQHFDVVDRMLQRAGIPVDAPEVAALSSFTDWADPVAMIDFAQEQVQAYRNRTANQPNQEPQRPANLARTPTMAAGGTPAAAGVDEEYRRGMAELVKRRAPKHERLKYRDEMRRKGANI